MSYRYLLSFIMIALLASCSTEETEVRETQSEPQQQRREPVNLSTQVISNPKTANKNRAVDQWPEMRFEKYDHNFGEIREGEKVEKRFKFTNTGNAELVIFSAKGTCGCTVPDYPRNPIAPGETGEILVTYDSSNRTGLQEKTVNITANTNPNVITLHLVSRVVKN